MRHVGHLLKLKLPKAVDYVVIASVGVHITVVAIVTAIYVIIVRNIPAVFAL